MHRRLLACLALGAVVALGSSATRSSAADWPQWRGPDRTGISKETGLLKEWPKEGPPLAWKTTDLGGGYSTPSVAEGRIFGMSYRGKDEVVWALEEKTGKEIWATKIATAVQLDRGEGSRCTPTVDGKKLYALGTNGDLVCLDVEKGEKLWAKNLPKDFGGGRPGWGYSESVLIDGDKLVCTPGGKNTIVALDKTTGETIWKGAVPKADGAHYSSVIAAEIAGQRQYIQFVRGGVVSVGASDGAFLWRYDAPANGTANCSTPIFHDGHVFAASDYGVGGGLVKVTKGDDKFDAAQVYFDKSMKNHHGGLVLVDGFLYGEGGGQLRCVDFKTDKLGWEERRTGKGSVTYADGHLYFRNEGGKGTIILLEANPTEYVEKGRFDQPERSKNNAWPHPVVANGKLYIRDQGVLLCYDIKKK
jgi:outer membrane protein assembly factor BamB